MTRELNPKQFAHELLSANDYRTPMTALSTSFPTATADDAYIIQVGVMASTISRNDPIIGAKVTVHDRRPVFCLYPRSALMGTFEVADLTQAISASVQPVLVLRLFKELAGTDITEDQVCAATESVVAGIEVVDNRLAAPAGLQHVDAIADNGGVSRILVGEHGIDISKDASALETLQCSFVVNGVESGPPPDKIISPLAAVCALANHLGQQGGRLEADWFVVVGPIGAPTPLSFGSKIELHVNDMASVRLRAR